MAEIDVDGDGETLGLVPTWIFQCNSFLGFINHISSMEPKKELQWKVQACLGFYRDLAWKVSESFGEGFVSRIPDAAAM